MLGLRQVSQSWGNSLAVVTALILCLLLNSTLTKRVSQREAFSYFAIIWRMLGTLRVGLARGL